MKLSKLFLIAVCALTFLACSATPSPTEVFKAQNEAQRKKDVATMKQNLSKGSLELAEKTAKAQNKTVDELLAVDIPAADKAGDYETRNEKINGDAATLEVKAPQGDQWITMPFVKEDGKWKIALDKFMQDLMQQMTDQMKSAPTETGNSSAATDGGDGTKGGKTSGNMPTSGNSNK